jgi:hypothetical protein
MPVRRRADVAGRTSPRRVHRLQGHRPQEAAEASDQARLRRRAVAGVRGLGAGTRTWPPMSIKKPPRPDVVDAKLSARAGALCHISTGGCHRVAGWPCYSPPRVSPIEPPAVAITHAPWPLSHTVPAAHIGGTQPRRSHTARLAAGTASWPPTSSPRGRRIRYATRQPVRQLVNDELVSITSALRCAPQLPYYAPSLEFGRCGAVLFWGSP